MENRHQDITLKVEKRQVISSIDFCMLAVPILAAVLNQLAPTEPSQVSADFELFKIRFNKVYLSSAEEAYRERIFPENFKNILKHNQRYQNGQSSYFQRVNKFTGLTFNEFKDSYLGLGIL